MQTADEAIMAQRTQKGQDAESKRTQAIFDEGELLKAIDDEESASIDIALDVSYLPVPKLKSRLFTNLTIELL